MKTDLDTLLTLISATIFADQRIYASEVLTFIKSTKNLRAAQRLDPELSEARLLTWFENNKDDIRERLVSPGFENWFFGLLGQLEGIPEKDKVLTVMTQISSANGEAHVDVTAWIQLVSHSWEMAA